MTFRVLAVLCPSACCFRSPLRLPPNLHPDQTAAHSRCLSWPKPNTPPPVSPRMEQRPSSPCVSPTGWPTATAKTSGSGAHPLARQNRLPTPGTTAAPTGRRTAISSPSLRTASCRTRNLPIAKRARTTHPAASGSSPRMAAKRARSTAPKMTSTPSPGRPMALPSISPSSSRSRKTRPMRRSAIGKTSRATGQAIAATCFSASLFRLHQLPRRSRAPHRPRLHPISSRCPKAPPSSPAVRWPSSSSRSIEAAAPSPSSPAPSPSIWSAPRIRRSTLSPPTAERSRS